MYRKSIDNYTELAEWYDNKYIEMGDGWTTPPEDCNKHLDALGVQVDHTKLLLDVGCGAGHFLAEATKRCTCAGVDMSAVGIGHASLRAPEAVLDCMEVEEFCRRCQIEKPEGVFDYVVSIGSLEHVLEIHKVIIALRSVMITSGKWYFYVPNEKWIHEDQPNERTYTDGEWAKIFNSCGLIITNTVSWGDNTAFMGTK